MILALNVSDKIVTRNDILVGVFCKSWSKHMIIIIFFLCKNKIKQDTIVQKSFYCFIAWILIFIFDPHISSKLVQIITFNICKDRQIKRNRQIKIDWFPVLGVTRYKSNSLQ